MTRRQILDERRASTPVTVVTILLAVLLAAHIAFTRIDAWLGSADDLVDGPGPSAYDLDLLPELLP